MCKKQKQMNKLFYFVLALTLSSSVFAQSKEVIIKMNHLYKAAPFVLDNTYDVDESVAIEFSRMEFYLHINSLVNTTNESIELDDTYILVNPEQNEYSIGDHDISTINTVLFHLGVALEVNHSDPAALANSHPLSPQVPSMHWGWAAGYRFIAAEGMVDKNQDGVLEAVIQYHAVSDDYYTSLSVSEASVETESTITIYLDVNYDKMFENMNTSNAGVFHGSYPQNQSLIDNIVDNNVFSVTENLSIEEVNTLGTIYPNPFKDVLNLDLQQNSSIHLYNTLGALIEVYELSPGLHQIETSQLTKGMYIVSINNLETTEYLKLLKE